jgi:Zn-dependent protease
MFDRGYWKIGSLRGVPIRFHWTVPLGALVLGGFSFMPAFWVSFALLVLLHELGHATLVRHFGHRNHSIDVTGLGGLCRWSGHATSFERAAIAWGGVIAQALLLVFTLLFVLLLGSPSSSHASQIVHVFTRSNAILIGLNLLPFAPLDGAEAWKILRHERFRSSIEGLKRSLRSIRHRSARKTPKRHAKPAEVIDLEARRRQQGTHDKAGQERSAQQIADELIRLSQEAAKAKKKRDLN